MMIIKLLAVVMLAGSVGISTNKATPGIKQAAPATYDLWVGYYTRVGVGTELWAYTSSGGGITSQVYFTRDESYYYSTVDNYFFASEFNFVIRLRRSTLNDELFTNIGGGLYKYVSIDGNFSYYQISAGTSALDLSLSVLDADYYINAMLDVVISTTQVSYIPNPSRYTNTIGTTSNNYSMFATYALPTVNVFYYSGGANTFISGIKSFYFKLNAAANIEGDDWWDIYNQGVNAGYNAGLDAGYDAGLDAGRLENTAWEDAFTIIKGAIDTVGDVMGIHLFGPITIGTLVSIPLIVGLLFWIIDKWRGS